MTKLRYEIAKGVLERTEGIDPTALTLFFKLTDLISNTYGPPDFISRVEWCSKLEAVWGDVIHKISIMEGI